MKKILTLLIALTTLSPNAHAIKILFFGDSHSVATVGPFGIRMNNLLRSIPNAEVTTHARCGSILSWWYSGKSTTCGYFDQSPQGEPLPPIPTPGGSWAVNAPTPKIIPLIEEIKPDLIVIEMGGNYQHANNPNALIKSELGKFITDLENFKKTFQTNTQCVWIGLPSRRLPEDPIEAKKFQAMIDSLVLSIQQTVEASCEFIDSTKLTVFPTHGGKDGVHYSFKEGIPVANAWAEKAFIKIQNHLLK
jgi:hypothetical protein